MSEPYGRTMIQVEDLISDAWEWWENKVETDQENIILSAYMKEKKIGPEEVKY